MQRTAAVISCYSLTKDCRLCSPVLFAKRLLFLFVLCLQRAAESTKDCVLVFCYSSAKDCILVFCYSSAKDSGGPCLLPFICKGLRSLSFAIRLQRTAVLVFCYLSAKDCGPCLLLFICLFIYYSSRWSVVLGSAICPIFPLDSKEYCSCYC